MSDKKHILFISSWYPNRNNPTHGIFNKYFALATSLYCKVSVIAVSSENNLRQKLELLEVEEDNITTINAYYRKVKLRLPVLAQFIKRRRVLSAFDAAYHLLVQAAGKPELIQLNVVLPMGIGALYLSRKYKIPLVINENWSGYCAEDGAYRGFFKQFFTRRIVAHAKTIMPTSTYLMEAMQTHQLAGKYKVVPNVVDISVFKPLASEQTQTTRLIHISSLNDREKNVSGLLRAFHKALSANTPLHLTIVGEGVDRLKYEQLISELAISDQVMFTGRMKQSEVALQIARADALIMFSNYETFCLVIIEAFACGKPVITSNAGAIKTYMQPFLGLMVPTGDEESLSSAIRSFVSTQSSYDPVAIRNFAVENYSYEKVGQQLNTIYEQVLVS